MLVSVKRRTPKLAPYARDTACDAPRLAALLWCLVACARPPAPPVLVGTAQPHLRANPWPQPAQQAKGQNEPSRLSPAELTLPRPAADASVAERQFYAAATRTVRLTYEDDVDDPSQLLALRQRLAHQTGLAAARPVWLPLLDTSLARAQTLRQLGPTLRALRQALSNTWRDEATHSYRDVDAAGCRIACAALPTPADTNLADLQETVVTIEPLGVYPLRVFLQFCAEPRSLFDHE